MRPDHEDLRDMSVTNLLVAYDIPSTGIARDFPGLQRHTCCGCIRCTNTAHLRHDGRVPLYPETAHHPIRWGNLG